MFCLFKLQTWVSFAWLNHILWLICPDVWLSPNSCCSARFWEQDFRPYNIVYCISYLYSPPVSLIGGSFFFYSNSCLIVTQFHFVWTWTLVSVKNQGCHLHVVACKTCGCETSYCLGLKLVMQQYSFPVVEFSGHSNSMVSISVI